MKSTLSSLLVASALALGLLACSDDASDPAPVGAGGSPGSVPARAQSCGTIDKGAQALIDEAKKQAAASAGAPGSGGAGGSGGSGDAAGSPSFCETYYSGCTDEDVALVAPQFECFASHSQSSSEEVTKACPSNPSTKLSAACEASLDKLKPPAQKAICSSYFSCVFDHYKGEPGAFLNCIWEWFYIC